MIRPRNLAIPPLLTIAGVALLLVGAALLIPTAPSDVVPPEVPEPQPSVTITAEDVPRYFGGDFIWDVDPPEARQQLGLDVHHVTETKALIVATGRGTYSTDTRNIDFDFEITIDRKTGAFTMRESRPSVSTGFVTDGEHVTTVLDSLDDVTARWIGADGMQGTLTLHAAETTQRVRIAEERKSIECGTWRTEQLKGGVTMEYRHESNSTRCVTSDADQVTVHYEGWNDDGIFDSSIKRGRPATFRPRQVIEGWKTALHELCVGDEVRVWIPSDQAYGDNPRTGIPTGDLAFDIEVLDVKH